MRKHILVATVLSVSLSAVALGLVMKHSQSAPQAQQRPNLRAQTLRTQAKLNGSAASTAQPTNLRKYNTVSELARDRAAIVVGTVESKNSQLLQPAEKFIVTDYGIIVRDLLKGSLLPGQSITTRGPGGRVDFGDGTWAEVKLPDFWKNPEVGKTYVFFLEKRNTGYFVLRGGPQGFFEITPSGRINPQVRPEDKLMQTYDGKNLISFLAEIRQAGK